MGNFIRIRWLGGLLIASGIVSGILYSPKLGAADPRAQSPENGAVFSTQPPAPTPTPTLKPTLTPTATPSATPVPPPKCSFDDLKRLSPTSNRCVLTLTTDLNGSPIERYRLDRSTPRQVEVSRAPKCSSNFYKQGSKMPGGILPRAKLMTCQPGSTGAIPWVDGLKGCCAKVSWSVQYETRDVVVEGIEWIPGQYGTKKHERACPVNTTQKFSVYGFGKTSAAYCGQQALQAAPQGVTPSTIATKTPTPTSTPTRTPSATPTPTPIPTTSGTPVPCVYIYKTTLYPAILSAVEAGPTSGKLPMCLTERIDSCNKKQAALTLKDKFCKREGNLTSCKAHTFRNCMWEFLGGSESNSALYDTFLIDENCARKGYIPSDKTDRLAFKRTIWDPRTRLIAGNQIRIGKTKKDSQDYMVCGTSEYLTESSPISLIFSDGLDLNRDQSIVSFAINPGAGGKLFTWKGSSDAPLLVYDPTHSGTITSASQLFGNWTFGGKRVASLTVGEPTQWRDGYEALESLDGDQDGKISGDELQELALWFDHNRNAISEPGEVQSLNRHGVLELFFQPDRRDEINHTISATRGFTRLVKGEKVTGKSVDWYAQSADSVEALLGTIKADKLGAGAEGAPSEEESRETKPSNVGIEGEWSWQAEGGEAGAQFAQIPGGKFIISEVGEKEILVFSMSTREAKVVSTGEQLLSLTSVDMVGHVVNADNKEVEIEFETSSDVPGVKLHSKAKMTEDGNTLRGYTVASGKDSAGSDKTLRYSWIASRATGNTTNIPPKGDR